MREEGGGGEEARFEVSRSSHSSTLRQHRQGTQEASIKRDKSILYHNRCKISEIVLNSVQWCMFSYKWTILTG